MHQFLFFLFVLTKRSEIELHSSSKLSTFEKGEDLSQIQPVCCLDNVKTLYIIRANQLQTLAYKHQMRNYAHSRNPRQRCPLFSFEIVKFEIIILMC